jgi:hypothetical protein
MLLAPIIQRKLSKERASPFAKAQPEADPPPAEMHLYLEEACELKWRSTH